MKKKRGGEKAASPPTPPFQFTDRPSVGQLGRVREREGKKNHLCTQIPGKEEEEEKEEAVCPFGSFFPFLPADGEKNCISMRLFRQERQRCHALLYNCGRQVEGFS